MFNLPFDLVELVQGVDERFIVDTLEKNILMSLPSEQEIIFHKFHYVLEQCVLDTLNTLKSLQLCEKIAVPDVVDGVCLSIDVWLLTDKGLRIIREIEALTSESRTMRELKRNDHR